MVATSAACASPRDVDVAAWLARGGPFGATARVEIVETHAATIYLSGDRAWKLKRAVAFGYLDFTTPERRRAALDAELHLNRRTAPSLYLNLHSITVEKDGTLALDGRGAAIDWLLEMRRFPDEALLAKMVGRMTLDDALLMRLADAVVAFHATAGIAPGQDGAERIRRVVDGNTASMAEYPDTLDPQTATALTDRLKAWIARHSRLLDARARAGRIRHCHGDLHLANIVLLDGVPTPFDCLEFDAELATIDVLYDLAFLLMDFWARGLRREAGIVANRYLDLSAADESGIALVPFYMSVRASIRAHVLAAQAARTGAADDFDQARRYLALARDMLVAVPPRLVAIGGLSGSGKSTLARSVGGEIGVAPGARVLRSDVVRKRLAGVGPEQRLDPAQYTEESSRLVYAELRRLAGEALGAGQSVIVDAVFSDPAEREAIADVAALCGVGFHGFWLDVPEAERVRRIEARGPDASDANGDVARRQSTLPVVSGGWIVLAAGQDLPSLHRALERHLRAP
ncbi:aminoglycoside phosphotransferase [Sphingomonas panacis]|uniref:Aminoglycoside phosphotransferase n=1 Tax=Sphingomonas panacis TaxID=1560345 RepID=A0A1B3Z6T7_9SPHN|nr:bifunctional aminoglycoside phosphotransferase/ATP-binding protein [Sphingomonas panacis]AOH83143.1 aminoglycoside phosphotransferase [Sphingomonas panacis]